jgi:hypothetical protein
MVGLNLEVLLLLRVCDSQYKWTQELVCVAGYLATAHMYI